MRWRAHWHYPFGTVCLFMAALLVGLGVWAQIDILEKITTEQILIVGVARVPCDKNHLWGHVVYYKLPVGGSWARVCRDWIGQKWVFTDTGY